MPNSPLTNHGYPNPEELTSQQLRERLRSDLECSSQDTDPIEQAYLFRVMEVLVHRDTPDAEILQEETEAAWTRFLSSVPTPPAQERDMHPMAIDLAQSKATSKKRRTFSPTRILLAAALSAFLTLTVVATAFQVNLFALIGQWTVDRFSFGTAQTNTVEEDLFQESYPHLQEARELLLNMGLDTPLLPRWFPSEYTLGDSDVFSTPDKTMIFFQWLSQTEPEISMTITYYSSGIPDRKSVV